MKSAMQIKKEWARLEKAREDVSKKNAKLIQEWDSIPWWKFWIKRLTFEEKRSIIIDNWRNLNYERNR